MEMYSFSVNSVKCIFYQKCQDTIFLLDIVLSLDHTYARLYHSKCVAPSGTFRVVIHMPHSDNTYVKPLSLMNPISSTVDAAVITSGELKFYILLQIQ